MYKFSRLEIIEQLLTEEKTKDNNFWFPFFWGLAKKKGEISDKEYVYGRDIFAHQMYFSPKDISRFLEINPNNFDNSYIFYIKNRNKKFYHTNKSLKRLCLSDKIEGKFSVEEFIDCFNFLNP